MSTHAHSPIQGKETVSCYSDRTPGRGRLQERRSCFCVKYPDVFLSLALFKKNINKQTHRTLQLRSYCVMTSRTLRNSRKWSISGNTYEQLLPLSLPPLLSFEAFLFFAPSPLSVGAGRGPLQRPRWGSWFPTWGGGVEAPCDEERNAALPGRDTSASAASLTPSRRPRGPVTSCGADTPFFLRAALFQLRQNETGRNAPPAPSRGKATPGWTEGLVFISFFSSSSFLPFSL